jgi:spermidine synthase
MPAAVFGTTIFLSAFLLFLIQPIFAKLILPWFGGSSAVWSTCLVFFQSALLAGYAYAHVLTRRVAARWQPWIHGALLAAALAVLPVLPGDRWKPSGYGDPALRILAMLTVVLGLPYVLLSSTSPLLQKWMSRTRSPYRFFALSNAGSLLALAAYPILIEPRIPTRLQNIAWSGAFAVFAVLCGAAAWIGRPQTSEPPPAPAVKPEHPILWLLLSATGSMFLVSTTSHMTQNVAAVPFLWILPLSAYLLSFIICFDSPRWYKRGFFLRLLAVALGSLAYALYDIQFSDAIFVAIPLFTIGLFIACMFCHGELSRLKPDAPQLTAFYLMIALGGALGAVFTGLIAPRVFSGIYEFPLSLVLAAALALWLNWRQGWAQRLLWAAVMIATVVALGEEVRGYHKDALALERSFYGSLRVVEANGTRTLLHGTVKHGVQYLDARRDLPTAYFGPESGAGIVLESASGPKRVGIIGLGAGTLAAYGKPGDSFRFYEINPQVIALAKSHFTFLSDSKAAIDISLGDARLSLERESSEPYDIFLADAFSGDAIPVHLLTTEAFDLYLRHLKPNGILGVHVSNQYLDLAPVIAQLAAAHGMQAVLIASPKDDAHSYFQAEWVIMTRGEPFARGKSIATRRGRIWTDDYNNLLEVFRF